MISPVGFLNFDRKHSNLPQLASTFDRGITVIIKKSGTGKMDN
jgi:hypothetical protein